MCVRLYALLWAVHWFDLPTFYTEAHRIIRPGGVLASWGYATCTLNSPPLDALLLTFYDGTLREYWSPKRRLVDAEYAGMEPTNFPEVKRFRLPLRKTMTVGDFVGYLSTWSAYQDWKRAHGPDAPDVLQQLRTDFLAAVPGLTDDSTLDVEWPMFGILARKT